MECFTVAWPAWLCTYIPTYTAHGAVCWLCSPRAPLAIYWSLSLVRVGITVKNLCGGRSPQKLGDLKTIEWESMSYLSFRCLVWMGNTEHWKKRRNFGHAAEATLTIMLIECPMRWAFLDVIVCDLWVLDVGLESFDFKRRTRCMHWGASTTCDGRTAMSSSVTDTYDTITEEVLWNSQQRQYMQCVTADWRRVVNSCCQLAWMEAEWSDVEVASDRPWQSASPHSCWIIPHTSLSSLLLRHPHPVMHPDCSHLTSSCHHGYLCCRLLLVTLSGVIVTSRASNTTGNFHHSLPVFIIHVIYRITITSYGRP